MKILDVPQSGSLAGITASHNRFGQYRRTRATPVNPNTAFQADARNTLAALSAAWRGLTDNQRAAWESFALSHPRTDSLGQSVTLSGHQMYVSVNAAMANAGLTAVSTPDAGAAPGAPTQGATTLTAAGLSIIFGTTPVPTSQALVIETSPPVSAGRSFNRDYRVVKVRAAAAAASLLKADLETKFGTLVVGQTYFARASIVTSTGLRSAYESVKFTLT